MAIRNPPAWMWAEACEMLEQAQRLQRQFFRFGRAVEAQPRWEPPVDIVAYGDEVQVTVALPGVPPEHIDVDAEGGLLVGFAGFEAAARCEPDDGGVLEVAFGAEEEEAVPLVDQEDASGGADCRLG